MALRPSVSLWVLIGANQRTKGPHTPSPITAFIFKQPWTSVCHTLCLPDFPIMVSWRRFFTFHNSWDFVKFKIIIFWSFRVKSSSRRIDRGGENKTFHPLLPLQKATAAGVGQSYPRSFFCVSHMSVQEPKHLSDHLLISQLCEQGVELEVKQSGLDHAHMGYWLWRW